MSEHHCALSTKCLDTPNQSCVDCEFHLYYTPNGGADELQRTVADLRQRLSQAEAALTEVRISNGLACTPITAYDKVGDQKLGVWLREQRAGFRARAIAAESALAQISKILGNPCKDNHCEGCRTEMELARAVARAVLDALA